MESLTKTSPSRGFGRILQRKSEPLEPHQDGESLITTKPKKSRDPTYTVTPALPSHTHAVKQRCPAAETPFAGKVMDRLTDLAGCR